MVHGLAMLLVDHQLPALLAEVPAVERLADAVIDVVERGLQSEGASARPSRAAPRRRW
jgi:hypothetical protein